MYVPTYLPLPERLTAPIAAPFVPMGCTFGGVPVACVGDALLSIDSWRSALARCNADRAAAAQITHAGNKSP